MLYAYFLTSFRYKVFHERSTIYLLIIELIYAIDKVLLDSN